MSKTVKVKITQSCVIAPEGADRYIAEVGDELELSLDDAVAVCSANRGVAMTQFPSSLKGDTAHDKQTDTVHDKHQTKHDKK